MKPYSLEYWARKKQQQMTDEAGDPFLRHFQKEANQTPPPETAGDILKRAAEVQQQQRQHPGPLQGPKHQISTQGTQTGRVPYHPTKAKEEKWENLGLDGSFRAISGRLRLLIERKGIDVAHELFQDAWFRALDRVANGPRADTEIRHLTPDVDAPIFQPAVITHILYQGYPKCRFTTARPVDWPKGHEFVSVVDAHAATCEACKNA